MIKSGNNIIKVFPKILKFPLTIMIFISCAARIDHFGNDVNLGDDRIYLSKIRKDTKDRDKYYLTFVAERGKHTKLTKENRAKTLKRYIKLIKEINGYTKTKILKKKSQGVIGPRYFVTVKFE